MCPSHGPQASGFKNVDEQDSYDTDGTRLFQIRGTNDYNTRAIQVPEKAASLNSGDVFCLETPSNMWLWMGRVRSLPRACYPGCCMMRAHAPFDAWRRA